MRDPHHNWPLIQWKFFSLAVLYALAQVYRCFPDGACPVFRRKAVTEPHPPGHLFCRCLPLPILVLWPRPHDLQPHRGLRWSRADGDFCRKHDSRDVRQ